MKNSRESFQKQRDKAAAAAESKDAPAAVAVEPAEAATHVESEEKLPRWRVSLTETTDAEPIVRVVEAHNEREAWAIFCDAIRRWPSPMLCRRKIEALTDADAG